MESQGKKEDTSRRNFRLRNNTKHNENGRSMMQIGAEKKRGGMAELFTPILYPYSTLPRGYPYQKYQLTSQNTTKCCLFWYHACFIGEMESQGKKDDT
eukprot:12977230-Heterocapsa_arctica.AAC.1